MTFITNIALRTTLVPFTPFINITWLTNRELALMTSNKQVAILLTAYLITTNFAYGWLCVVLRAVMGACKVGSHDTKTQVEIVWMRCWTMRWFWRGYFGGKLTNWWLGCPKVWLEEKLQLLLFEGALHSKCLKTLRLTKFPVFNVFHVSHVNKFWTLRVM